MPKQFTGPPSPRAAAVAMPALRQPGAPAGAGTPADGDAGIVIDWLSSLQLLKGVPFNHLVPDIGMLPTEAIRLFTVDPNWIAALLDGAFGVGTVVQTLPQTGGGAADFTPPVLSGFLLRSAVVTGWPGMQVRAYADTAGKTPLTAVRLELVGPAAMLGLFAGSLARIDFQEPSEGLHFGVDAVGPPIVKTLRWAGPGSGNETVGAFTKTSITLPTRDSVHNVLPMNQIATQLMAGAVGLGAGQTFTAADFGLEMIEGVQVVSVQVPAVTQQKGGTQ